MESKLPLAPEGAKELSFWAVYCSVCGFQFRHGFLKPGEQGSTRGKRSGHHNPTWTVFTTTAIFRVRIPPPPGRKQPIQASSLTPRPQQKRVIYGATNPRTTSQTVGRGKLAPEQTFTLNTTSVDAKHVTRTTSLDRSPVNTRYRVTTGTGASCEQILPSMGAPEMCTDESLHKNKCVQLHKTAKLDTSTWLHLVSAILEAGANSQ